MYFIKRRKHDHTHVQAREGLDGIEFKKFIIYK